MVLSEIQVQLFREDPQKTHNQKKKTSTFEKWKDSLRNHQNSKTLASELSSLLAFLAFLANLAA